MTNNSSEIILLKHYILLIKRDQQCTTFDTFSTLMKVYPILHAIFETTRLGLFKFCIIMQFHES